MPARRDDRTGGTELTDGQGRALSAHKSKAYEGYAKRTEKRVLTATERRHAHVKQNGR